MRLPVAETVASPCERRAGITPVTLAERRVIA
nr:MAG TPA: hypothetical protein [Caudoviricetes sp.]